MLQFHAAVFELTYNYGVDSYTTGNDVQYFAIAMPEAVSRAAALGYRVEYIQVHAHSLSLRSLPPAARPHPFALIHSSHPLRRVCP